MQYTFAIQLVTAFAMKGKDEEELEWQQHLAWQQAQRGLEACYHCQVDPCPKGDDGTLLLGWLIF